jgi:hypothetical protein
MRHDMAKVIVERPRLTQWCTKTPKGMVRRQQRENVNDAAKRESMRRKWIVNDSEKQLNENLAPLRRFLETCVGMMWNMVYSQICERINRNSPVQLHVWQHIWDFVEKDVIIVDGKPRLHRASKYSVEEFDSLHTMFYIHPVTGKLEKNFEQEKYRPSWLQKNTEDKKYVEIDGKYFRKLNNIWYEVTLTPLAKQFANSRFLFKSVLYDKKIAIDIVLDHVLHKRVNHLASYELIDCHGYVNGEIVYASAKRQLGKQEIRKLGLNTSVAA